MIYLLLLLNPALGFPVAKRLSHSEIGEDVLAGSDFLSVFMKASPARSIAPSFKYSSVFGVKNRNSDYSETNSVVQKTKEDIHSFSDINLKGEDALESGSHEPDDNQPQLDELINSSSRETMTTDEKNTTDTTTASPATTTITDDAPASTYYDLEEDHPSIIQGYREDRSTKPTVTQYWSDPQPPTPPVANSSDQPLQVISVRVSSSVVRHSLKVDDALKGFENEKNIKPASTLVTQEQPTNTAIQRSHFNVEEATLPDDQTSYHEVESSAKIQPVLNTGSYQFSHINVKPTVNENNSPESNKKRDDNINIAETFSGNHQTEAEEEERKIQQTDFLKIQKNQNTTQIEESKIYFENNERTRKNNFYEETNKPQNSREPQVLPFRYKFRPQNHQRSPVDYHGTDFLKKETVERNVNFEEEKTAPEISRDQPQALAFQYNPQTPELAPVSYHTSVSSATSGSRIQFYRGPPSYNRGNVAETVNRAVISEPKSDFSYAVPTPTKPAHQEPVEKGYELPEQNYEVDESISVVTNGRSHGVQIPTPTPTRDSSESEKDENKSGYVVEGRNFRKYRVEERTADGFIVGEYGVVSHDDGSLRGVRYTADSTINPRLIYDALVKFLSLK